MPVPRLQGKQINFEISFHAKFLEQIDRFLDRPVEGRHGSVLRVVCDFYSAERSGESTCRHLKG